MPAVPLLSELRLPVSPAANDVLTKSGDRWRPALYGDPGPARLGSPWWRSEVRPLTARRV